MAAWSGSCPGGRGRTVPEKRSTTYQPVGVRARTPSSMPSENGRMATMGPSAGEASRRHRPKST